MLPFIILYIVIALLFFGISLGRGNSIKSSIIASTIWPIVIIIGIGITIGEMK